LILNKNVISLRIIKVLLTFSTRFIKLSNCTDFTDVISNYIANILICISILISLSLNHTRISFRYHISHVIHYYLSNFFKIYILIMSNINVKLQIIAGCLHCKAQHNFSLNCKDISKGTWGSFTVLKWGAQAK